VDRRGNPDKKLKPKAFHPRHCKESHNSPQGEWIDAAIQIKTLSRRLSNWIASLCSQ
jgi:hypothetical protein